MMRRGAIHCGCFALAVSLLCAACQQAPTESGSVMNSTSSVSAAETSAAFTTESTLAADSTTASAESVATTTRPSHTESPFQTKDTSVPTTSAPSTAETTTPTTSNNSDDAPYKAAPNNIFPVVDRYGMRGVSIIGDSISHGANVPKIYEQSYVGLFKKKADTKWSGGNYGFVSLLASFDNASGVYREIHNISRTGNWEAIQTGDFLGAYAMRSTKKGDKLFIKPRTPFRYAAVFYEASPSGGNFEILVDGRSAGIISTKASARDTAVRTDFIPLDPVVKSDIQVVNANGGTVTITGVGYYNSRSGMVVNNYSRSGLQLVQVDDETLKMMCQASVVVFAMGHNDMWQSGIDEVFAHKIDVVIQAVKANKAKLVVSDFTWGDPKGKNVRKELKRLAEACGGVYHDYATEMKGQIQDGSHPYPAGHEILANALWNDLGFNR